MYLDHERSILIYSIIHQGKRDERQTEIDTIHAKQVEDAGPMTSESRARVGFDMARKIARGEMITTDGSVSSGNPPKKNDELTNEWDRKKSGTNSQSSDDRVWKSFMTNQRNRRETPTPARHI